MSKCKKIKQYKLNGSNIELISTYNSIKEASKSTNINRNSISASLNNKHKTAGNYIWKYAECIDPLIPVPRYYNCEIVQIDPFNRSVVEKFSSMREASRKTNISVSHISECVNGKSKTAGNYIWKRISDIKIDGQNYVYFD